LEEALYVWFRQMQAPDFTINEDMLKQKAIEFGKQTGVKEDFFYSSGWLQRFKKRFGIESYVLHGEARDANNEGVKHARRNLRLLLEPYNAEETNNQDETGVFWRQAPTRTLATGKRSGHKKEKERVTASLMCNAAGTDKWPLMIIGKSKRPRSFPKSFQPKRDLGVRYANNKMAWMTTKEYSMHIKDLNAEMKRRGRSIVLLGDNVPTHTVEDAEVDEELGFKVIDLSNVKLIFLPANTTSVVQPLDQGIIAAVKAHYRRLLVRWLLTEAGVAENKGKSLRELKPTFYQMMQWLQQA
jgi:hypothetical protein